MNPSQIKVRALVVHITEQAEQNIKARRRAYEKKVKPLATRLAQAGVRILKNVPPQVLQALDLDRRQMTKGRITQRILNRGWNGKRVRNERSLRSEIISLACVSQNDQEWMAAVEKINPFRD